MMKVLLVALLFASMALADITLTGRFATGTGSFFPPTSDTTCVADSSPTYYKVFNQTFLTAGVRTVQLLASSTDPIYIYRGSFDPTTPCINAQTVSISGSTFYRYMDQNTDNTQTLQISQAYLFAADLYFFVVTSDSVGTLPAASYSFGVRVLEPVASATTTQYVQGVTTANVWQAPYTDSSSTVQFEGDNTYVSFVYTATTTERFDIGAFSVNISSVYGQDVFLGVFPGTPSAQQIFDGTNGIFPSDNGDDDGVWLFFYPMTAGQTYTFVASTDVTDSETSNIGFFVVPTAAHRLTAGSAVSGVFSEPASFSAGSPCTSRGSSYVGLPYTTASFNVLGNIVVAKSSDGDSYNQYLGADLEIDGLDWYTYLYRGNNSESPAGCPITPGITYVSSTDDGTIYNPSASAAVHTLVVSTYSSSPSVDSTSGIVIFYFVGPTLGESVSVPTTAPTTSTPTTSTPTTSTPTTSTPTTSTPSNAPATPAPTANPCQPKNYTGATISFNAPGQCANASVVTILFYGNQGGNIITCANGTGNAVTLTVVNSVGTTCTVFNATLIQQAYENFYGFTNVVVTAPVTPTTAPTTATPTGTPTGPTPTPTNTTTGTTTTTGTSSSSTSGAASVVASFVVLAALGLFL